MRRVLLAECNSFYSIIITMGVLSLFFIQHAIVIAYLFLLIAIIIILYVILTKTAKYLLNNIKKSNKPNIVPVFMNENITYKTVKINNREFKYNIYSINSLFEPSINTTIYSQKRDWYCQTNKANDKYLPYAMKDYYQEVNPDTIYKNSVYLSKVYVNREANFSLQECDLEQRAYHLIDLIETSSTLYNQSRYFLYTFDYEFCGLQLYAPWVSGIAQGKMLSALTFLWKAYKIPKAMKMADEFYNSFFVFDNINYSFIRTLNGYYWIEEYPHQEYNTYVLNGHITALFGLYNYLMHINNLGDYRILYSAIESVKQMAMSYRINGGVNLYDLYYGKPDYWPERTIFQQNDLYAMTGDPSFKHYADVFSQDIISWRSNDYVRMIESAKNKSKWGKVLVVLSYLMKKLNYRGV